MILSRIRIQNFRAIQNATFHFGNHTAILGANGTGKSTVLRAIERFFSPNSSVQIDDFFGRRAEVPIEITLTFSGFTEDELVRFDNRIVNGEMTVTRVFETGGGRANGKYFGSTLQFPAFAAIRSAEGANEKRRLFTEFREANPDFQFQAVQRATDIEPQLARWEQANPQRCELLRDDGQFFGFSNVARGNLQRSTSFVFVPAVRDAADDAVDGRNSVIARLMELIVRSAIQQRNDVRDFRTRISNEYRELVDPARLPELEELAVSLSGTLREYYADSGVNLQWRAPEEFAVPLPSADVLLEEGGFSGPVDRKGHGLQRAFIVTLLQHLAHASAADAERNNGAENEAGAEQQGEVGDERFVLPGLILAIEEPELYQHPTKQRHLARVLKLLSEGRLPGVASTTQVMFATHSPLFVGVDRFDEIRLARRIANGGEAIPECSFTFSNLDSVARKLEAAHQRPAGDFNAEGIRARLHTINAEVSEGFFASLVVLVEGAGDRAALLAAANLEGFNLEANGIAISFVEGKNNLDRPATIFLELGIPVYLVWDCDDTAAEFVTNRALQRLMGAEDLYDSDTRVTNSFATFAPKLEDVIRAELTEVVYNDVLDLAVQEFGMEGRKAARKAPYAMTFVLQQAAERGFRSQTLANIVAAIRERVGQP